MALAALVAGAVAPPVALVLLQAWTLAQPASPLMVPMHTIMRYGELLQLLALFGRWIIGPIGLGAGAGGMWLLLRARARGCSRLALLVRGLLGGAACGALVMVAAVLVAARVVTGSSRLAPAGPRPEILLALVGPLLIVGALTGIGLGGALAAWAGRQRLSCQRL